MVLSGYGRGSDNRGSSIDHQSLILIAKFADAAKPSVTLSSTCAKSLPRTNYRASCIAGLDRVRIASCGSLRQRAPQLAAVDGRCGHLLLYNAGIPAVTSLRTLHPNKGERGSMRISIRERRNSQGWTFGRTGSCIENSGAYEQTA
jgi:hypothetical protein